MASVFEEGPRKVVPKWRPFAEALKSGELAPVHDVRVVPDVHNSSIKRRQMEFNANRTIYHATDLLSCAVVLGLEQEVRDAAVFVMENTDDSMEFVRKTAKRILDGVTVSDLTHVALIQKTKAKDRVALLRSVLDLHTRNAFLWCDLALNYDSLGNHTKAERALQIARTLAPDDRFVLRAAAKFHHANRDFEQAHRIVKKSTASRYDPWIMATEIALSEVLGKSSQLLKAGCIFLDDMKFTPFHMSELASSIGTFEFYNDSISKARKHLELSLCEPLENSIAQATWIMTKNRFSLNNLSSEMTKHSTEARALDMHFEGKWSETVAASEEWAVDEPYLATPSLMRAGVYTMLRDCGEAIKCLLEASKTHRNNPIILNGLAFNYARIGQLDLAHKALAAARRIEMPEFQKYVFMATNGYLHLRRSTTLADHPKLAKAAIELGRDEYTNAIAGFERIQNDVLAMNARIYYALAESDIKSGLAAKLRIDVISRYDDCYRTDIKELLRQVRGFSEA